MSDKSIRITSGDDVPSGFGERRCAVKKTTVAIREPNGVELFEKSWGTLTASPGADWVIIQDSGDEYPIKKDIFEQTYEEVTPGRFRKTVTCQLVQVPVGVVAILATQEGDIEVVHPDYVVIGANNEVYANRPDWVEANLEFIS